MCPVGALGPQDLPSCSTGSSKDITSSAGLGPSKPAVDAAPHRWGCARCKVSVGRIDGEPTILPPSWSRADDQIFCLTCSRTRAGEVAMDSAPEESSRQDRVRLRRTALIEFEIDRVPEAPNRTIALACRTSPAAVAAVRDEMERTDAAN